MRITGEARAKINWALNITGRRPDGYHELDMLMQSIELSDSLCFETAEALSLTVDGAPVARLPMLAGERRYTLMAGLDLFHWFMPLSGDCWICGEIGGGKHPRQTAGLICDTVQGREFYLHALIGSEDIAFPNLDPQMQAMKEYSHVFVFGKNTHYSVLEGGVHDYPDIRRYIYNALPEFFR